MIKKNNDGVVFELTDTKETVDLGSIYTKIGTKSAVYEQVHTTKDVLYQSGTYTYKVCTNYTYTADANTIYRIDSDWAYVENYYRGYNPPADTMTSRWIFQGIDYSQCGNDCTNHPYVVYKEQTRKVTAYTEYSNVTASCANVEERSIPLYGTRKVSEYKTVQKEPAKDIYAYVRYYKVRTRTLLSEAKTVYKWSSYNDQTLLSQGYSYTGKTRNK